MAKFRLLNPQDMFLSTFHVILSDFSQKCPILKFKVISELPPKKFGQYWQKMGNYLKRHWFLGKVVLFL